MIYQGLLFNMKFGGLSMCPYFDERNNVCKIYKTTQNSYQVDTYCKERTKSCTECANYKECMRSYGGVMPAPYKF